MRFKNKICHCKRDVQLDKNHLIRGEAQAQIAPRSQVNRKIFSALITVGGFALIVQLTTVAKELVVAARFGTGDVIDAFLIAFLLPLFAVNVLAGSFKAAFIPTYVETREQDGESEAKQLYLSTFLISLVFLVGLSVLLGSLSSVLLPLIGSGFSAAKLAVTQNLFFLLLPVLVITGIAQIWAAVLNAGERFALPTFAPILIPALAITFLVIAGDQWGIYALAAGIVTGAVAEILVLAWGLRAKGFDLIPRWNGMNPRVRQVIRQYVPMVAGSLLLGSTMLVDQVMAAMLGPSSVATLSYGTKITGFFLGLGTMALGTAVLPHFSNVVANKEWQVMTNTLRTYAWLIILVCIPLAGVLFWFSESVITMVFERGAFSALDTQGVGRVQAMYVLQIPFYMLGILIVRLISSLKANHILMWGAAISLFLNIALNYLLMQWIGVAGIALSTSIVYMVSFLFLWFMLSRLVQQVIYASR